MTLHLHLPLGCAQSKWQTLSDEDVKALLNHYTGRRMTWENLNRIELETLLNYLEVCFRRNFSSNDILNL